MNSVRPDTATPPLTGLSTAEAERRRAAGQGNDVEIRAGRTYGRIVRDNVFNFINNLFYFLGILLLDPGQAARRLRRRLRDRRQHRHQPVPGDPRQARDGQDGDPHAAQGRRAARRRAARSSTRRRSCSATSCDLHPGDQVVVDGPMVGEGRMEVDESLLTGESDLVTKHPGDELMSGSFCMTGGGYYEAAQVGLDSFANKLTAKAKVFKRELTPLQRQVMQIVRVLLIVVIVFEILVWVRNVAGGVPFVESVRMSTVILALIPNGLVLSIALTYALGAVRLLGKDVLVQQFNAVESLSNVDVLCTDKTGTLTSGVIDASRSWRGAGRRASARAARLLGAFAASTTDANRTIEALRTALPAERLTAAHEAFFSSERKWSGLAFAGRRRRAARTCSARRRCWRRRSRAGADWRGAGRRLGGARPARRAVRRAGRAGRLRASPTPRPSLPDGLEALALICFSDELRPGVRETLEEFSDAGIEVKIISGDNPKTVVALATQAGVQSLRRREGVDSYCDMVAARRRRRAAATRDADAPAAAAPADASGAARSSPSPAPTSPSSRPRSSPPRPTRPASSAASRPSRSRTSSRPCAPAAATWR